MMSCSPFSPVKLDLLRRYVQPGAVLDVGCGRLHYARWMREHVPGLTIVGLDLLEQQSEPGIEYKRADLERGLGCADCSYASVVAFDIVEHIENERFFIAECYRVLSPGGVLIGSVPHDVDAFLPRYNLTFFHRSDVTHKRYYTESSVREALVGAGFERIEIMLGGGISPHVIAEFFPSWARWFVRKAVGAGRRLGFISDGGLRSDLFFVAYKKAQR